MSDYLYIDTANARRAAARLQSMATAGVDHASAVRRACTLAELADTTSARLETVAEALTELGRVLIERSDAADAGGLLPYRSTSLPLKSIGESLHGYAPPRVDELFPPIGPQTTSVANDPTVNPQCSVDDHSRFPWDELLDPLLPIIEPVIDQPIVPLAWWEVAGQGVQQAWEVVESAGNEVEEQLSAVDWSAAERFVDRVRDAASSPLVLTGMLTGGQMLPFEVASHYGIVGVGVAGFGLAYTQAGDGRPRAGISVPVGLPSVSELLPNLDFTKTSSIPADGFTVSSSVCDVICLGTVAGTDGSVSGSIGFGAPSVGASPTVTKWFDAWPALDD